MKNIIRHTLTAGGIALSLILGGCASVDITKTAEGYYSPTNPNKVEILTTRPSRSYIELGTINVTGFSLSETARMHNAIRAKAAPLGADAVIITQQGVMPGGWDNVQWAMGVAVHYQ